MSDTLSIAQLEYHRVKVSVLMLFVEVGEGGRKTRGCEAGSNDLECHFMLQCYHLTLSTLRPQGPFVISVSKSESTHSLTVAML